MTNMAPLAVSVQEAATMLGVCRQTLARWERAGIISFARPRGRTLVPVSELHRLLTVTPKLVGEPVGEPRKLIVKKRKLIPKVRR